MFEDVKSPKRITPSPIAEAVFEIRFTSDIILSCLEEVERMVNEFDVSNNILKLYKDISDILRSMLYALVLPSLQEF